MVVKTQGMRRWCCILGPPLEVVLSLVLAIGTAGAVMERSAREAIYANVAEALEVVAPSEMQWGGLVIGTNVSAPQVINVKSNCPYSVKMHSVTRTKLAEYDLTAQQFVTGGRSLSQPLCWIFDGSDGEPRALSRSDEVILSGVPATSDSGDSVSIRFVQQVGYGDVRLPEGYAYRIDVIYTVVQDV